MKNTKQVIVIRRDLNMRKGKMCAQASHASMAFLTRGLQYSGKYNSIGDVCIDTDYHEAINHWLRNSFRKIVCYVNSEEELVALYKKALAAGLISHLVEDNGATEFNGIKTRTALAIGPHFCHSFEGLTDHLPLL